MSESAEQIISRLHADNIRLHALASNSQATMDRIKGDFDQACARLLQCEDQLVKERRARDSNEATLKGVIDRLQAMTPAVAGASLPAYRSLVSERDTAKAERDRAIEHARQYKADALKISEHEVTRLRARLEACAPLLEACRRAWQVFNWGLGDSRSRAAYEDAVMDVFVAFNKATARADSGPGFGSMFRRFVGGSKKEEVSREQAVIAAARAVDALLPSNISSGTHFSVSLHAFSGLRGALKKLGQPISDADVARHEDQPPPRPHSPELPCAWPTVIAYVKDLPFQQQLVDDMQARHDLGMARYGVPLQPLNGRDQLRDLYEELLDAVAYAANDALELRELASRRGDAPIGNQKGALATSLIVNDLIRLASAVLYARKNAETAENAETDARPF